ncbi:glycosyltransferase [Nocardioides sp. zg-1230]|uniref:glycosyltransferase n=1 Tax=Nocardioides sp. zg-1230 TaxID=2736601 RepID=UPI00155291DE|nr:hypothetical protein [Nocardioides sp. zg-1230]NPC43242.1 hypothetical protein [Nocardioides sp. zg-1230]NPC44854.1 hypothetical protein [Nocardioides sp. zg-1230]
MATTERKIHRREVSDADLLRESELFDEEFYLQQLPKLREQGKDPVQHYLTRGGFNGKDPSAAFSSRSYLQRNPEVAAAKINPLVHYLRIGRAEGRSMNPLADDIALIVESGLFDPDYYRHFHPDLPEDADLVRHYLRFGARRGDDPSELFSTTGYQRQNVDVAKSGANPLLHYLRFGRHEGRIAPRGRLREPYFDSLFAQQWAQLAPLPVAHLTSVTPRVTVLTDSVGPSSLFGGVGTSVILAILLANRFGATLRIATRTEAPDPSVVATLEQASGVRLEGALETAYVPVSGDAELAVADDEIVMTTSWWTTRATLGSTVPREQVLYLLQEDERMFYAFGDERLMCSETLGERGFTVVVNTQRLLDHLGSPDNYPHLAEEAIALTPAFPGGLPRDGAGLAPRPEGKRRLFFYSRPENARNLFWRGGTVLSRAVEQGVLDPDEWELYLVGRRTPDLTFPRDTRPLVVEGLNWLDYQALVHTIDAALVLMDTPHPSYPPLDLAAAGVPVLTNTHGSKQDLSDYSANILTAPATVDGLLEGMQRLLALSDDREQRAANLRADSIERDWTTSLAPTVDALVERFAAVMRSGDVR